MYFCVMAIVVVKEQPSLEAENDDSKPNKYARVFGEGYCITNTVF